MGTDSLKADSRFDFLSLFNPRDEDEDDAVPDSFFINDQCSPYSNVTINCNYIDIEEICNIQTDKISVLSLIYKASRLNLPNFLSLCLNLPLVLM